MIKLHKALFLRNSRILHIAIWIRDPIVLWNSAKVNEKARPGMDLAFDYCSKIHFLN